MNNVQVLQQPVAPSTCNKPIELYIFIDPLDERAHAMQLTLRRLQVEYGHYFTCRYVLSTELSSLNCMTNRMKGCVSGAELDITHPALPSIAIKAAELQGKRAGFRYLNKVQEVAKLKVRNINSHATLIEIAQHVDLDMNEFMIDFGSKEAARSFQSDLYLTREMEVEEVPSIVFFNECIEDEGLKVSGSYQYEVYEHILAELLGEELIRELAINGQIATQYVDLDGNATSDVHFNPNDSMFAIEGITSPDGRVFGKMGHSERIGDGLYKNVPGNYDIKMFKAAVEYYK